jgi:hypothetical protein
VHLVCRAFSLAALNTGNNIAAKVATMAMTTNNSISVKPLRIPITSAKFRRNCSTFFEFVSPKFASEGRFGCRGNFD